MNLTADDKTLKFSENDKEEAQNDIKLRNMGKL
jgi:hypothetical protein